MLKGAILSLYLFAHPTLHFSPIQSVDMIKEMKNTNETYKVAEAVKRDEKEERRLHTRLVSMNKEAEYVKKEKAEQQEWKTYIVTAYDLSYQSTGKRPGDKGFGITKSGEPVKQDRTVSADLDILPIGTVIDIETVGVRVVTDSGSAIRSNRLDLYIESHKEALQFGKRRLKVRIIKLGSGKIE